MIISIALVTLYVLLQDLSGSSLREYKYNIGW